MLYRCEPSLEDIDAANQEIQKHERAVSAIQEHIATLLSDVQRLRREQQLHKEAIQRCMGVITLARRIPEELLSKIFEHCVQDGWTRAPIVVSHVCSAWRRAASAPRVWSHVYVNCDSPDTLGRTRFWLAMSRQAPLTVTVMAPWNPERQLAEVMDLLLLHAHRWRTLSIETGSISRVAHLLRRVARSLPSFPLLSQIGIRTIVNFDAVHDEGVSDVGEFTDAFSSNHAPNLSTVCYISNAAPLIPIFPTHIVELNLTIQESSFPRPLSSASLITVLEGVPALRILTLSMPLSYEHPFVPERDIARAITLPALESLTLYGPTDLNEFLPHLRTPALRRLHLRSLEDLGYRQQPIAPSLLQFLSSAHDTDDTLPALPDSDLNPDPRTAPLIELLELHDIDLSPEAFAACFAALPQLRELRLHESSIRDATVRLLCAPAGLCPRLARLDLRWCGLLSGRVLVELVRGRNVVDSSPSALPAADPITEVAVINCCFVGEKDVLDLATLTACRVVMRGADDYCWARDCCVNARYRMRLRLKHLTKFSAEERLRMSTLR